MGRDQSVPIHPVERKLVAIFAADIADYSRLMARDDVGTLARLKACRAITDELIAAHRAASSMLPATVSSPISRAPLMPCNVVQTASLSQSTASSEAAI